MAAPNKVGLEYFSHDTDTQNDKKVRFLKAKAGITGYAIYMMFLEELYKQNGYYLEINDDYLTLFCYENNIDIDELKLIIDYLINYKLFNKFLYDKYQILTSERSQKNYFSVIERRRKITFVKEYLLLNPLDFISKKSKCYNNVNIYSINVNNNSINDNNNSINAGIYRESKVKESKEKEKEREREKPPSQFEIINNFFEEKINKKFDEIKEIIKLDFDYPDSEIANIIISWFNHRSQTNWQTNAKNPIKIRADNMMNDLIQWFSREYKLAGKGNGKQNTDLLNKIKEYF